jgi:hypothetical protein
MQNLKRWKSWLFGALLVAVFSGGLVAMYLADAPSAVALEPEHGDHWGYHDGHWNFWHDADHRWYHTDGAHWYYHDGKRWSLYDFDKNFGRSNFRQGAYRRPGPEVKVVVPQHGVYIAP